MGNVTEVANKSLVIKIYEPPECKPSETKSLTRNRMSINPSYVSESGGQQNKAVKE